MPRSDGRSCFTTTAWWCFKPSASSVRRSNAGRPIPERACRIGSWALAGGGSGRSRPGFRLRYFRVGGSLAMGHFLARPVRDGLELDAALFGDAPRRREVLQRVQRGPHHVVRVGGAEALGEDVAHAGTLQHRAHRAAGDDPGPGRGRLQEHAPRAVVTDDFVRDGRARERDLDQATAGGFDRLAHRLAHLVRLAGGDPDAPLPLPPHSRLRHPEPRQGARRAPFRHPRAPSPPARSSPGWTARAAVRWSLELQSAFAGAVGHRLHAPVILVAAAVEHDLGDPLLLGLGGEQPSQPEALGGLALAVDLEALGSVCGPDQCDAPRVVHDLRVDMLRGAEHHEARSLRAAGHLPANPEMAAIPSVCLRADLMDLAHSLFRRLGGLAGLAPDLLARVADPLAFVGLGRPDRADLRRHLAHELLVDALDLHEDVVVHRDLDPLRRVIWHRVGEADDELHAERLWLRLVAHPLDLERLRKPLGDAVDHVGDERAGESVERLVPALIGGPPHDDRLAFHRYGQLGVDQPADLALRTLHGDAQAVELGGDALGNGDWLPADTRHGPASYQTSASSSPPMRAARASRSVMSPCGVERIAIPRPFLTRGISRALT